MVKIAIGLGHRVLGPTWTFGSGGMMLRDHLFPDRKDVNFGSLRGSIDADLHPILQQIFGVSTDRHVLAVVPAKKKTLALIALFAGELGNAVVDLIVDSRRLFNRALNKGEDVECAFSIPLNTQGARPLETRSILQLGHLADANGLLPNSRAHADALLR